ncbi:MAG: UDP-3-O-(3-hydroxymyristoyl)glucosamine N-acyltransferase [Acidobacteriota bacterium]
MDRRLAEIAAAVGGTVEGDPDRRITGLSSLDEAGPSHLSFLAHSRYRRLARGSGAGAILAAPGEDLPGKDVVRVADPYLALARALELFAPPRPAPAGIDPRAVVGEHTRIGADPDIHAGVVLGENVLIGDRVRLLPHVVVGAGATIGHDTTVHPHVCIYPGVRIGERVILHAGSVIGADGFGYAVEAGQPVKIRQAGGVVIEDDVEIGAGACIDRGTLGDTRVCRGARIDNLVQVAHNVRVGAGTMIAAQAGISGSTRLGRGILMAGQSGIVGHVTLGDGARVAAKSAVTKDVPAGRTVAGIPAVEIGRWRRAAAVLTRLPEVLRRLRALERGTGPASSRGPGEGERRGGRGHD